MKTVNDIIKQNEHIKGQISVRYSTEHDLVIIDATKDALLFLARVFEAQANNFGNMPVIPVNCTSGITKSSGFLTDDSVKQLQIHNWGHGATRE